ncbi:HD domain-containing protein [Actinocorallia sp. A-T 12471]|uniref:HD domain-containing protein n=1 Tax=Actinocorallia sp. A-T 12471 TaxID=3089813 RepID=UPI0029CC9468|nr:HD domain-containing protein [Actinocorallia sp. A-T 12471]MDX6744653.1 HD domain-containing protein [Actinocorallia sp. A-T 12471]
MNSDPVNSGPANQGPANQGPADPGRAATPGDDGPQGGARRVPGSWASWRTAEPELATLLDPAGLELVKKAADAAARWHGEQLRPTGEPYTVHLFEALEVIAVGAGEHDPEVLAATLLHDVVEDTPATLTEVEAEFGPVVAEYVDWVTKPPAASKRDKRAGKVAYLRRLRDAPAPVVAIKLADRASNVATLHRMPADFQRRYHAETVTYLLPLAEGHPFFEPWYRAWSVTYRPV